MDRFVKRSCPDSGRSRSQSPQPPSKKPTVDAKQGNVSAAVRVAEFGKDKFLLMMGSCSAVLVTK